MFKGLGAHTGNLQQFPAGAERAVGRAVVNDIFGKNRSQSGNVCQQMAACGVDIDSNQIDTTFHRLVERFFQFCLVYIVLILSHADRLGINLDEFCQRIHQAAADRDSSPYGYIIIREFITGCFGS